MSRYTLKVNIKKSDYPELGNPFSPDKIRETKVPRKDKEDYEGYRQSTAIAIASQGSRTLNYSTDPIDPSVWNEDEISMNYTYEDSTSKTYKFVGMDVDEDFNAVIKVGEGHVIVGPMFDRKRVDSLVYVNNDDFGESWMDSSTKSFYKDKIKQVVSKISENNVRKIATSLKTGSFYSLRKMGDTSTMHEYSDFLDGFVKGVLGDYRQDISNSVDTSDSSFSSVILNIVHKKEIERESVRNDVEVGTDDQTTRIIRGFLTALFKYWSLLASNYSQINSELSALDLWSGLNKRVIGDVDFNSRIYKSMELVDSDTGELVERVVSFSGVSKNGGVFDSNVIRDQASQGLVSLGGFISGSFDRNIPDIKSILISNIDSTDIEDVWSLTDEEAQALSVIDSLRYIDEDADISKASYDMDDPEQRGLFVKSCIRSYERNFKEFKPVTNYDVTEALADIVERGDIESNPEVTMDAYAQDQSLTGDVVTSTQGQVVMKVNTQDLKRIMKLVNKFSKDILDGFSKTQTA